MLRILWHCLILCLGTFDIPGAILSETLNNSEASIRLSGCTYIGTCVTYLRKIYFNINLKYSLCISFLNTVTAGRVKNGTQTYLSTWSCQTLN
jgi:hypothetical protein